MLSKKRRIELSLAAIVSLGAGFTGFVQPGEARSLAGSAETSAMIQGPLLEEFGIADDRGLGFRQGAARRAGEDASSVRPRASQFAIEFASANGAPDETDPALSGLDAGSVTLAQLPSGGRVSLAVFDAQDPNAARLAFDSEFAEAGGQLLTAPRDRPRALAVRYERSFDSRGGVDGLDVGVAPRAGLALASTGAAAEFGGTVRLGQYLGDLESEPRWWVFAGADRQALLFDPSQGLNVFNAFAMEPYAVVGDAQAGVAARLGEADLSLAYVHRETTFSLPNDSWEQSEGFVAFTFSMRR
jgi:hypothetical protein